MLCIIGMLSPRERVQGAVVVLVSANRSRAFCDFTTWRGRGPCGICIDCVWWPSWGAAARIVWAAQCAMMLADGCYYVRGRPTFRITGDKGEVLVPGEVKAFRVKASGWTTLLASSPRHRYAYNARATFPGFVMDGNGTAEDLRISAYADREPWTFRMRPETSNPTVLMFWSTFGDQEATLGKAC